jgi:hypothetical protein
MPQKSVLFLFGKGDMTVPNPTTTAILRAGDLADRTIFFRNDLALAEDPLMSRNPLMNEQYVPAKPANVVQMITP